MNPRSVEITVFAKDHGPLTKRIHLVGDLVANDSAACRMGKGSARRVRFDLTNVSAFADLINGFTAREAYALGRLKDGLPETVRVVAFDKLGGATDSAVIARTKDFLILKGGEPAIALLDVDLKGIPEETRRRIKDTGGVAAALCSVVPSLVDAAYVERPSTSAGLRNRETGDTYPGSGGFHAAIAIADGADIERFLSDLHDRLWLAGFGWGFVSAAGSFLERSLVDKACGSPERLIFEGPPIVEAPLEQEPRPAVAHEGGIIDTSTVCPPLSDAEKGELDRLKAAERARLKPQMDQARAKWAEGHIERMVAAGAPEADARATVDRWIDGQELSGDFPLPFDDPKLAGATVADVIARPDKFGGKTLSDPFEGPAYGRGKAILYRRADGSLFVNSFAHGGVRYELCPDSSEQVFDPWERYIVPEFPLIVLPTRLQAYVVQRSEMIGCDRSAFAMAALTAISAALDHRFGVKMMRHSDWWEHPRLWTLLVGDPSAKKTPAINQVTRPLERYQGDLLRDYEAAKRDYEAAKKDNNDVPEPNAPERYIVWDSTTEKLGKILADNSHEGLLVKRDEFAGWLGSMDKYSGGTRSGASSDRAFWLKAYDGGPYAYDRINRGTVYIRNLSVSLLGGVQHTRLVELGGLTSDGLLQRFVPIIMRSSSLPIDRPSGDDEDEYQTLLFKLIKATPRRLFFSDEALVVMNDLRAHLFNLEQASDGVAFGFQAFVGKLSGIAGRLALILQLATYPDDVSETIHVPIANHIRSLVHDFILPHAFEFYRQAEEMSGGERLRAIASWILTSKEKVVASRDLSRNVWCLRGLTLPEMHKLLSPLVVAGWLEPKTPYPSNREWTVTPLVEVQFERRRQIEEDRKRALAQLMGSPRKEQA
jgi:hypothetical protein